MKKGIAILLLTTLIFPSVPLQTFAEENQTEVTNETEQKNEDIQLHKEAQETPEEQENVVPQIDLPKSKIEAPKTEPTPAPTQVTPFAGNEVSIPDAALKTIIKTQLNIAEADPVMDTDLLRLSKLSLSDYSELAKQVTSLEGLQYATNLTNLTITGENITDISQLASLTKLTYLYINGTSASDISPLANLTNLVSLLLPGNGISDLTPLQGLTNLTGLNLYNNELTDLTPLRPLTNLTWLYLTGNKLKKLDGIESLVNLEKIHLDASGNLSIGGSGGNNKNEISDLTPLAPLTNLKLLWIDGYRSTLSDLSPLANLTKLEDLRAAENTITDISATKNMVNLNYLDLSSQSINDLKPLEGLTNLTYLSLENNRITDISVLSNLTKLTQLYLGENQISSIEALKPLTELRNLYLLYNQISDLSPLENVTKLRWLRFDSNQVSNIQVLANLKELNTLFFPDNHVSDISALENLTNLTSFYAGDQVITLPDGPLNLSTEIAIKDKDNTTPSLTWTTPGNYEDGQLKWDNVGNNQLKFSSSTVRFNGTIKQNSQVPVAGGDITVEHVTETGEALIPTVTLTGFIGDPYQTKEEAITGYSLKTAPNSPTGFFTADKQTITYVYQKDPVAGETVTAKFLDTKGNVLAPEQVFTGNIDETYQTTEVAIEHYVLTKQPQNAAGIFTDQKQEVLYVYEAIEVAGKSVIVSYKDSNNQEIAPSEVLNGKVGAPYQTQALTISGYHLVKTPNNAAGTFTQEEQSVTYLYEKDDVITTTKEKPANKDNKKLPSTGETISSTHYYFALFFTLAGLMFFIRSKKNKI